MPHDYDLTAKAYRDAQGRLVSRREVRDEIEKLTEYVSSEAASIAERFSAGSISIVEFEIEMRELLKSAHIIAASVGRGGRVLMTVSDWGRVGSKIRWQYDYLAKFARKLSTGKLLVPYSKNRARAYASAVYVSYANARQIAQKEAMANGTAPQADVMCRLVQNSKEGCVECTADAGEGWMTPGDMAPIGSRLCGDFCLCEIEFSDEG